MKSLFLRAEPKHEILLGSQSFHINSPKSTKPHLREARIFSREDLSILITDVGVCIFKIKISDSH